MSKRTTVRHSPMGHFCTTISPRKAAVLRERRVQIALDPTSGVHRITMV